MTDPSALSTKALTPDAAHDEVMRTFEAWRETNDARLQDIETRLSADVLIEEKLSRLDDALDKAKRALDDAALRAARPVLERGEPGLPSREREHKAAFARYLRSGEAQALRALETKALSAGSGPDGGFLVAQQSEREILRRMTQVSPIRAIATVRETANAVFKKAYSGTGPGAGWVGETAARPQTASQVLTDLTFPTMELYAMPSATQTMLDDAAVDVEAWIADEIETVFAEQEGVAFVNGDGVSRPQGFLTPTKTTAAGWAPGKITYLPTGVAGGFPATNPSDILVDLCYALKAGYRQNARFVMSRRTQAEIRKFKATTGEYLWQPPLGPGQPATLMNFPVVEAEDMPPIDTNSFAIAFGDFKRGYLIVDRVGVRVLRDPYSAKPYVLFYTTKRVGGGVQDFDAIKLLRFGVA